MTWLGDFLGKTDQTCIQGGAKCILYSPDEVFRGDPEDLLDLTEPLLEWRCDGVSPEGDSSGFRRPGELRERAPADSEDMLRD